MHQVAHDAVKRRYGPGPAINGWRRQRGRRHGPFATVERQRHTQPVAKGWRDEIHLCPAFRTEHAMTVDMRAAGQADRRQRQIEQPR